MAVDMFIKLDAFEGESRDKFHKNEIEILSFSWGVSQTGSFGSGGGGGQGKAEFTEFSFLSHVQKSSPGLFLAVAQGQHIKEAVVSVRKAGSKEDFYKLSFNDLLLRSLANSASEGGEDDSPTESITFAYNKVAFQYRVLGPGGSIGEWISATWDVVKGGEG